MASKATDGGIDHRTIASGTGAQQIRPQRQRDEIEVGPAVWVLEPGQRRVADAWVEHGCVALECHCDGRRPTAAATPTPRRRRWARGLPAARTQAIGHRVRSCRDFSSVSEGDVLVIPVNRRLSRLAVVVGTPSGTDRAHEREVLWVAGCHPRLVAEKADTLRMMSQLKQLG